MMDGFGHGWGMGWGWIIGLAIIVLVVWIILKFITKRAQQDGSGENTPLDILKERYARGEIDKNEYEEKKKDMM